MNKIMKNYFLLTATNTATIIGKIENLTSRIKLLILKCFKFTAFGPDKKKVFTFGMLYVPTIPFSIVIAFSSKKEKS